MSNNPFKYKVELLENGTWHEEKKQMPQGVGDGLPWVRPFVDSNVLDNSLDTGSVFFWRIQRDKPIKPFTPIRITVYENDVEVNKSYYFAGKASATKKTFNYQGTDVKEISDSLPYYNHLIPLIELTKVLERTGAETKSNTRYLGHDFGEGAIYVSPTITAGFDERFDDRLTVPNYVHLSPMKAGGTMTVRFSAIGFSFRAIIEGSTYEWDNEGKANSKVQIVLSNGTVYAQGGYDESLTFTVPEGDFSIKYVFSITFSTMAVTEQKQGPIVSYPIQGITSRNAKEKKSIVGAINSLLYVYPTRRSQLEKPTYRLDPIWEEKLSHITAPEFFAPQKTLFEALAIVVGQQHLIPRLKWDEETDTASIITFDELGGNVERVINERVAAHDFALDIDDYCEALDSTVSNVVNTLDKDQAAVTEPVEGGFMSMRAEVGEIEITDDTALCLLTKNIYMITKFSMGYVDSDTFVGVLTPHVYEQAEYDALYANNSTFPFSKKFALVYKQGDNKITGFAANPGETISGLTKNTVIENILKNKGINIPHGYKTLAYQVEYIPFTSARIIQKKPYIEPAIRGNTIVYNQSESTVEAQSYGENMKGAIARMGNVLETRTYKFTHYADIPKIGELVDGKYVASAAHEYQLNYIKCTITLAENFNQIMSYLGLDSNYRAYDVSEKQSYEREIAYCEDVIIGDKIGEPGDFPDISMITERGVSAFSRVFQNSSPYNPASAAVAQGISESGASLNRILLGCTRQGYGNTMHFRFAYQDNFSAGMRGTWLGDRKNEQRSVPYADVYGEIARLRIQLIDSVSSGILSGWGQQDTGSDRADGNCVKLPYFDAPASNILFETANYPLRVEKDSREHLAVNYMLCMRTNRRGIVLGTALTARSPLVSKSDRFIKACFFRNRLNVLNSTSLLEDAVFITSNINYGMTRKTIQIYPMQNNTSEDFKAWAIVNEIYDDNGNFKEAEIILGENMDIKQGEQTREIVISFPDNTWR